jgi:tetratricopeptide (TPR) repeat protein
MSQRVLHEGDAVLAGVKNIIRLDAIYEREGIYDKEKLEANRLAEMYLNLAGELERSGKGMQAVEYYKKAFRLNPDLERFS